MSRKPKGPVISSTPSDQIERRDIEVKRTRLERPSSIVLHFDCPFCKYEVQAYKWSLAGGGKRCGCGAFFVNRNHGGAYHFKNREASHEP